MNGIEIDRGIIEKAGKGIHGDAKRGCVEIDRQGKKQPFLI